MGRESGHLKPAPEAALARELAELAGGAGALAERALALVDGADRAPDPDADLRLAGHLAELAWLAAPDDPAVAAARATVFTRRAEAATSTMAKGVFALGGPGVRGPPRHGPASDAGRNG